MDGTLDEAESQWPSRNELVLGSIRKPELNNLRGLWRVLCANGMVGCLSWFLGISMP